MSWKVFRATSTFRSESSNAVEWKKEWLDKRQLQWSGPQSDARWAGWALSSPTRNASCEKVERDSGSWPGILKWKLEGRAHSYSDSTALMVCHLQQQSQWFILSGCFPNAPVPCASSPPPSLVMVAPSKKTHSLYWRDIKLEESGSVSLLFMKLSFSLLLAIILPPPFANHAFD